MCCVMRIIGRWVCGAVGPVVVVPGPTAPAFSRRGLVHEDGG